MNGSRDIDKHDLVTVHCPLTHFDSVLLPIKELWVDGFTKEYSEIKHNNSKYGGYLNVDWKVIDIPASNIF